MIKQSMPQKSNINRKQSASTIGILKFFIAFTTKISATHEIFIGFFMSGYVKMITNSLLIYKFEAC